MFPRMRLFLHPQTWCCIKPTQVWNLEVPWAAPKAQQSWGWEARDGHPRQQCLSCWPCSHSAPGAVKLISSPGHPSVPLLTACFWELAFVVRGEFPPLWADLLTFSSEPAESYELKGGSPAEGLAENLVRKCLALMCWAEYGQTDFWSYI